MKKRAVVFSLIAVSWVLCSCSGLLTKKESDLSGSGDRISGLERKIEELTHQVSMLQLIVDNHQKSIRSIESAAEEATLNAKTSQMPDPDPRPPINETEVAPSAPIRKKQPSSESVGTAYKRALAVYQSKNYSEAAPLFLALAENQSGHDLADNALYWAGESFYALKEYKRAVETFKNLVQKYPNGGKVPDALLKLGFSYLALKDPVNAQSYLKKVIKQYPFTPAAAKAEDTLKKMN
ncbi:MAG: tol-pal system protein YbgF, partial [Desulfobacteraceae bacterium]